MVNGGLPARLLIAAPICVNGVITRSIGRLHSESSPVNTLSKGWPPSSPARSRMAVPELPTSRSLCGACNPRSPTPCMEISVALGCWISTPSVVIAAMVARQSSPARNPLTSVRPLAMLPSSNARCETDLSPGTVTEASATFAGVTLKRMGRDYQPIRQPTALG